MVENYVSYERVVVHFGIYFGKLIVRGSNSEKTKMDVRKKKNSYM